MNILNQPPRQVEVLASKAAQCWSWYLKKKKPRKRKNSPKHSIVHVTKVYVCYLWILDITSAASWQIVL